MASETLPPESSPTSSTGFRLYWLIPLVIALVILYEARDVITPFIIAIVLAYLLDPFVAAVHRYTRAPRALVVVAMALLTLGIIGVIITLLVDLVANQGQQFIQKLPIYLGNVVDNVNQIIKPTTIQIPKSSIPGLGGQGVGSVNVGEVLSFAVTFAASTGQGLLDFLITFISTIYLLLDGHHLANGLQRFFPLEQRPRLGRVMNKIRRTWGSYIRAQLFLAALMAVVSWLILQPIFGLLGLLSPQLFGGSLPFALPVAIAVGLLETVPIVGPLAAIGLAAIVALATLGILPALMVIAALYLVRLVEDNIVVPNVLGHAIELPAIVTLFAVTVGGIIAGLVGLLLAVPVAAAVKVVIDEYYPHPHPAFAAAAAASTNHVPIKPEAAPADPAPSAPAVSQEGSVGPAGTAMEASGLESLASPAPQVETIAPAMQPARRGRRKSEPPRN